jgi:RNA polymerase sigma factor (sigma-70 family)
MTFDGWWGEQRPVLTQYARFLCRQRETAEDCVSDAYIAMRRNVGHVPPHAWKTYAIRAVYSQVVDAQRRPTDMSYIVDVGADCAKREDTRIVVQGAIAKLSPQNRKAVTACDLDGLTAKEAAARMGMGPKGITSAVFRGRSQIKRMLYSAFSTDGGG